MALLIDHMVIYIPILVIVTKTLLYYFSIWLPVFSHLVSLGTQVIELILHCLARATGLKKYLLILPELPMQRKFVEVIPILLNIRV